MRYLLLLFLLFLLQGCALKKGDYVHYKYKEYTFLKDMFRNQSFECVELGTIKKTDMDVKYCKSVNYANVPVEGFVFLHTFKEAEERFIAAKLYFQTSKPIVTSCSSQVLNQAKKGEEYILCLVARSEFNLTNYITTRKKDIKVTLSTPLGERTVHGGTITNETKEIIGNFIYNSSQSDFTHKSL